MNLTGPFSDSFSVNSSSLPELMSLYPLQLATGEHDEDLHCHAYIK